jgi:hypothetical protein
VSLTTTCQDFADSLDNTMDYESLVDEQFRSNGFNAEQFYKFTLKMAAKEGVTLTDTDSWDYESYFWNLYKTSEKGLS